MTVRYKIAAGAVATGAVVLLASPVSAALAPFTAPPAAPPGTQVTILTNAATCTTAAPITATFTEGSLVVTQTAGFTASPIPGTGGTATATIPSQATAGPATFSLSCDPGSTANVVVLATPTTTPPSSGSGGGTGGTSGGSTASSQPYVPDNSNTYTPNSGSGTAAPATAVTGTPNFTG